MDKGLITQTILQEKWNKGKEQIRERMDLLENFPDANLDYK
jgi:hypothetical protein